MSTPIDEFPTETCIGKVTDRNSQHKISQSSHVFNSLAKELQTFHVEQKQTFDDR